MGKKTIIMYSIPAYGHTYSTLYLMQRLKAEGYTVIYYSLEPFRVVIEASGLNFCSYPLAEQAIDLTDGKRLLRLYRLLLKYTAGMMPQLLKEARKANPVGVIFDSLALWGRAVGEALGIPKFSFYSIAAIDRVFGESFFRYAAGFSFDFFKYTGEIPGAIKWRCYLKNRYGTRHLGMIRVLMNQGDYNLMGYSRRFQPGGRRFGKKYLFLGALSRLRNRSEELHNWDWDLKKPLIYISLGTIFNENNKLLNAVIKQLGNQDVQVVMAAKLSPEMSRKLPANFITKPFWDQSKILKQACLFLSSGGMSSIHEALYYGVPCLFYPQQGEQCLNAKQFERLGFGLILKKPEQLGVMIKKLMYLKENWLKQLRAEVTKVNCKQALQIIKYETEKVNKSNEKSFSDRGNGISGRIPGAAVNKQL